MSYVLRNMLSPLRYPGGKAQYIPLIESYANSSKHSRYVEPFAGGAAVALHFAIKRQTPVVINDKDPAIYAFWLCILEQTEAFIDRVLKTPINIDEWHKCKYIFASKESADWQDLGFATFYLNRCNFSGCLTANPIGGIHQRGKWLLDARFNKLTLIQRIRAIAQKKDLIQVTNKDALYLLQSEIQKDDFVYLDPPYYSTGKQLYSDYLKEDGHEQLSKILANTPATWLMSYDNDPFIESLYSGHIVPSGASVNYSFSQKIKQKELLLFSHRKQ